MNTNLKTLTDTELDALINDALNEKENRTLLALAEAQARKAADDYAKAVGEEPAKEIESLDVSATIGPQGRVQIAGVEWVNISGAWLSPFKAGPKVNPAGWMRTTPPPGKIENWVANEEYRPGDLVYFDEVIYRALSAHKSEPGKTPNNLWDIWAVEYKAE
jgi:hypothetical protein